MYKIISRALDDLRAGKRSQHLGRILFGEQELGSPDPNLSSTLMNQTEIDKVAISCPCGLFLTKSCFEAVIDLGSITCTSTIGSLVSAPNCQTATSDISSLLHTQWMFTGLPL